MVRIVVVHLLRWMLLAALLVLATRPLVALPQQIGSGGASEPADTGKRTSEAPSSQSFSSGNRNVENTARDPLADFVWLQGRWQGNWGTRMAEQVWMGPGAGEMAGIFRVTGNDRTLVLELYSLVETSDGVELRLRHFTPSLIPWESSVTVLKLAGISASETTFENGSTGQPSRTTFIRIDPDTYLSRTELTSTGDNKQVTEIRFHRVKPTAEEAPSQPNRKR